MDTKDKKTMDGEQYFIKVPNIDKGILYYKNLQYQQKILMKYMRKIPRHVLGWIKEEYSYSLLVHVFCIKTGSL